MLERGKRIVEFSSRPQYNPMPVEVQAAVLWTVQNNFLDDVPVDKIKDFQAKLTDYLATRKAELLTKIRNEKAISDALAAELKAAVTEFKQIVSLSFHAQHTRHTPAHQVGQEHRPDHQGDADGGGGQDAQGAAGRARRASVCGLDERRCWREAAPRIAAI